MHSDSEKERGERERALTHIKQCTIRTAEFSLAAVLLWRNRLARLTVNQKVAGSSPARSEHFILLRHFNIGNESGIPSSGPRLADNQSRDLDNDSDWLL